MPGPQLRHDDDVLYRVLEVGVCGTDRALARFDFGSPPEGERKLVLGHEALGEVIHVGPAVHSLRPGDLVAPMVRRPCRLPCSACQRDRRDLCGTGAYTERGILGAHGYFADLAVDRAHDLIPVPPELRHAGVLIEPLSVVEKAVQLAFDAHEEPPRRALVLGAGPIGILSALVLLARGVEVIVHSLETPGDPRAALLTKAGAVYSQNEPPAADIVIEAAGSSEAGSRSAQACPVRGRVILGALNGPGELASAIFSLAIAK